MISLPGPGEAHQLHGELLVSSIASLHSQHVFMQDYTQHMAHRGSLLRHSGPTVLTVGGISL